MELNSRTPNILYVDDNQTNLKLISNILRKEGYKTDLAKSGQKALDYLEEKQPDLVLLNSIMPGMDSTELCKKIIKDKKTNRTPIIFSTAKSNQVTMLEGL